MAFLVFQPVLRTMLLAATTILQVVAGDSLFRLPLPSVTEQCLNRPTGRLGENQTRVCPLPGQLGIFPDIQPCPAAPWTLMPRCVTEEQKTGNSSRVHCLFTDSNFRNGHGTSLITSSTAASHLVGIGAFVDQSNPAQARKRDASGLAYEIVDIEGKGKGVVGLRNIKRGEIIMVDVPAVLVGTEFLTDVRAHHRRRMIKQAINLLPNSTRESVWSLSTTAGEYKVDSIMGANANTVALSDDGIHVGLFTKAARINHSCRPNAYYRFSEKRLTMEIVSYHTIENGEEIVMSYVPLALKRDERRRYLRENWGIDCKCSLCQATEFDTNESEVSRRRMNELRDTILDARNQGFFQDAINIAEDWLMVSEWERVPPLAPEYHDILAELYSRKGDMVNATRYGRMALDEWVRFGSVDDDQLELARIFLRDLQHLGGSKR